MGKTGIIGVSVAAVVAVAAIVACIFIFGGTNLPEYAPEDTEAIVYVNGAKIAKTDVFKAFQKTVFYEDAVKETKKAGVDIEEAIKGEACAFVRKNSRFAYVYNGDQAGALFKYIQKEAEEKIARAKKNAEEAKKNAEQGGYEYNPEWYTIPTLSTSEIDGKQAIVVEGKYNNQAAIMLNKKTLQCSEAPKKSDLIATPLKKKATDLTKAVDTSALISAAGKVDIPTKDMDDELKKIVADLEIVTASIVESGSDLEVRLVGTYKSSDNAEASKKTIEKQLEEFAKMMKDADNEESKLATDLIKAIQVSQSGKKVTISLKYSQDKLVKFIEKMDKEERASRKEMEEFRKKYEGESQALDNK